MRTNNGIHGKYSLSGPQLEKLEQQREHARHTSKRRLRPWVRIVAVTCVSAMIAAGVGHEVNNANKVRAAERERIRQMEMNQEAQSIAAKEAKLSDFVDVLAVYNGGAIDILAESLKNVGVVPNPNIRKLDSNGEFLRAFFDVLENKYKNNAQDCNEYCAILKKALKEEAIPMIIHKILVRSGEKDIPSSYKDVVINCRKDGSSSFVEIGYKKIDEYGHEYNHLVADTRNKGGGLPNNLTEMIMDTYPERTVVVGNHSDLTRFVADIEELMVDYNCYEKNAWGGIYATQYDTKQKCVAEHKRIEQERMALAMAKLMEEDDIKRNKYGFDR